MSRKKPIELEISQKLKIDPKFVFKSEVVRSGNGAIIKAFKRFIGDNVTVIVHELNYPEIEILPIVHYDEIEKIKGVDYYGAEISTGAGTHRIYLNKKEVDAGREKVRNPK